MQTPQASEHDKEQIARLFGPSNHCPLRILDALSSDPTRHWRVEDLVTATGDPIVEVIMAVARLTHAGLIEHPRAGRYRARSALMRRAV